MTSEAERPVLSRLLDAVVYAPLALVSEPRQVVADLAGQGRKQAAFSRSLGRAVLKRVAPAKRPATSKTPAKEAAATKTPATKTPATKTPATKTPATKTPATKTPATKTPATPTPDEAVTVAIKDYESLTARQIVALLAEASAAQAAWVLKTERAGKSRVTVLRAATAQQ